MTDAKTMEISERLWKNLHGLNTVQYPHQYRPTSFVQFAEAIQEATASMFTGEEMKDFGHWVWTSSADNTVEQDLLDWSEENRKEKHGARSQSGNVEA